MAISAFTDDERQHASLVVSIVGVVVESLARAFGPKTEVLLHDLTRMPSSIVSIAQTLTGRTVGGPPTDLGLLSMASEQVDDLIGYPTHYAGRSLRSSSIFFRAPSGRAVVALCVNADIDDLVRARDALAALAAISPVTLNAGDTRVRVDGESFSPSVETLADGILREALRLAEIPPELMKKPHKVEVVRELKRRGFFSLAKSVDLAAKALGVTRYTVYNYLNEIGDDD
ncbi:helix-turn-helix transcriptional regulator [Microbacterium forte]